VTTISGISDDVRERWGKEAKEQLSRRFRGNLGEPDLTISKDDLEKLWNEK